MSEIFCKHECNFLHLKLKIFYLNKFLLLTIIKIHYNCILKLNQMNSSIHDQTAQATFFAQLFLNRLCLCNGLPLCDGNALK